MRKYDAALLGIIGTLLVGALAVIVWGGRPTQLPPDSPERVVQEYLDNLHRGENEAALQMLPSDCDVADDGFYFDENFSARLVSVLVADDVATVEVQITQDNNDPFNTGYAEYQTFELQQKSGHWEFTEVTWPYYVCAEDL